METRAELIRDITQIAQQFKAEIPGGRRPWPKAVKDRALALVKDGMSLTEIAAATGFAYQTVHGWTRDRRTRGKFRELKALPAPEESAVMAIPPTSENSPTSRKGGDKAAKSTKVTIITPNGYRIEGVPIGEVAKILGDLA